MSGPKRRVEEELDRLNQYTYAMATESRELPTYDAVQIPITIMVHESRAAEVLNAKVTAQQANTMEDRDVVALVTEHYQARADSDPIDVDLAPFVDRVRSMQRLVQPPAATEWPQPPQEAQQ